ncbi:hypothetical protein PN836_019975 [Ningiella sp. W23]|uniref:hypothetical protein n=1 Tax=Ningiella sp. W23 TaxID=3023715 RepID=UPI0037566CCA
MEMMQHLKSRMALMAGVLGMSALTCQAHAINKIEIDIPYKINLGSEANVSALEFTCELFAESGKRLEPLLSQAIKRKIPLNENGEAEGVYTLSGEKGGRPSASAGRKGMARPRASVFSEQVFDTLADNGTLALACYWSGSVASIGASDGSSIATAPSLLFNSETLKVETSNPSEKQRISFVGNDASGSRINTQIDVNSTPFFVTTFSLKDNEFIAATERPEAPSEPSPSPAPYTAPTVIEVNFEVGNVCVIESDDWGFSGSNEDLNASVYPFLFLNDPSGKEHVLRPEILASVGELKGEDVLYSIKDVQVGERSCVGNLDSRARFKFDSISYGYSSADALLREANPRIRASGLMSDNDLRFGLVAPKLFEHFFPLDVIPICATCESGPGTRKIDTWRILTSRLPKPNNGIIRVELSETKGDANAQMYLNMEMTVE